MADPDSPKSIRSSLCVLWCYLERNWCFRRQWSSGRAGDHSNENYTFQFVALVRVEKLFGLLDSMLNSHLVSLRTQGAVKRVI